MFNRSARMAAAKRAADETSPEDLEELEVVPTVAMATASEEREESRTELAARAAQVRATRTYRI